MRGLASNIFDGKFVRLQACFRGIESLQPVFRNRENFRAQECSGGIDLRFELAFRFARRVFAIQRAAEMEISVVFAINLQHILLRLQYLEQIRSCIQLSLKSVQAF